MIRLVICLAFLCLQGCQDISIPDKIGLTSLTLTIQNSLNSADSINNWVEFDGMTDQKLANALKHNIQTVFDSVAITILFPSAEQINVIRSLSSQTYLRYDHLITPDDTVFFPATTSHHTRWFGLMNVEKIMSIHCEMTQSFKKDISVLALGVACSSKASYINSTGYRYHWEYTNEYALDTLDSSFGVTAILNNAQIYDSFFREATQQLVVKLMTPTR